MDTRDTKSSELGRHQRVLDAYLAHAGANAMPPAALDAQLIALAASSIKAARKAPAQETLFTHNAADEIKATASKINTRSRRRRWPFALAASVATIGFAAILARTTFNAPGYDEAVYQAPIYEAKSVAADQAAAADAPVSMDTPAPLQEAMRDDSRAQAASVAVMPPDEDKAKLSRAPDPEAERAMEQALGQVSAAPPTAKPVLAAKPVVASPARAPAQAAPPEVAELDAQAQRNRRSDVDAAPIVNIPTENGVAETVVVAPGASAKAYEPSAFTTDAKPAPQALPESQTDSTELALATAPLTRSEAAEVGASAPQDDAANAKKDELAPDAQTDPEHAHAKTYAAIRALRDSGELAQAKAMLARFKKAYPLAVLPEDIKVLGKTK